jgi:predicted nucleic acid-binding protein
VILVDTSAWLSLHDEDDRHHDAAAAIWWRLMTERAALCSTAYIRLETWSLLQARFGVEAVSFTAMREEAITTAFAFDQHFREYGFNVL